MKPQPVLYILVPTDMGSLNPGKMAAQVAHAANLMVYRVRKLKKTHGALNRLLDLWEKDGDGFGTTIVLAYTGASPIARGFDASDLIGPYARGTVYDMTYPRIVDNDVASLISSEDETAPRENKGNKTIICRGENTCSFLFCDKENPIRYEISHLQLHP